MGSRAGATGPPLRPDRRHRPRPGQTREVHVFSLCARHTAEERILEVLDKRIHHFELVIGEVDLILGRALDEKEFDERIFDIYATARLPVAGARAVAPPIRASQASDAKLEALEARSTFRLEVRPFAAALVEAAAYAVPLTLRRQRKSRGDAGVRLRDAESGAVRVRGVLGARTPTGGL